MGPLAWVAGVRLPALALNGAVAQMGERVVRNDEVRGSIPLGSTSANFPDAQRVH